MKKDVKKVNQARNQGLEVNEEDFTQNKDHIDDEMLRFQKRIAIAPDQIFRYSPSVLWVHSGSQPSPDLIPPCPHCNAPRVFECQLLPQLLYFLHVDRLSSKLSTQSISWSTLALYTCSKSCTPSSAPSSSSQLLSSSRYLEEFIWIQYES